MEHISKIKVLDVLSVCLIRHTSYDNCKCTDCKFYGTDCIEAHRYAESAVKLLKAKEVTDGQKQHSIYDSTK